MTEAGVERRSVRLELHLEQSKAFDVTYHNKDELYRSFKLRIHSLGGPNATAYWTDRNGDEVEIDSAETLLDIARATSTVTIKVRCPNGGDPAVGQARIRRGRSSSYNIPRIYDLTRLGNPYQIMVEPCLNCGHIPTNSSGNPIGTRYYNWAPHPQMGMPCSPCLPIGHQYPNHCMHNGFGRGMGMCSPIMMCHGPCYADMNALY